MKRAWNANGTATGDVRVGKMTNKNQIDNDEYVVEESDIVDTEHVDGGRARPQPDPFGQKT